MRSTELDTHMTKDVRVRFAPSPTGEPHVGNIRTALFTWLFARSQGGVFIVRIEDTDQSREVPGAIEQILDSLRWLGIDWDEGPEVGGEYGPYTQSERIEEFYDPAVETLLEKGSAYRCYCTPERLAGVRKEQAARKAHPGYGGLCRGLGAHERREREDDGTPSVVRFAMPERGVSHVQDLIRGEVAFDNSLIDDFVVLKSDGFPTYHLANVVDDHAMEISHVLRGEDWLPSAPRHLLLYGALGWKAPEFAHLPMILGPDRSKLSKRHGATAVLDYRDMGYLPQAMVNFLALLGWSLDDSTELFSVAELIESFSLEGVGKSGAVFNLEKLEWMDGHYIRQLTHDGIADALLDFWGRYPPTEFAELPERPYLLKIVPLIQERLKTLLDAAPLIPFFFNPSPQYDPADLVQKKMDGTGTKLALEKALSEMEMVPTFDANSLENALRPLADELGMKAGQLFGTLRVATTGLRVSPPLFETLEVLGRDRSLAAVRQALRLL